MNGRETLKYLSQRFSDGKQIAFSRYGDGEFYLMTNKKESAKESFQIGDLLKSSLQKKDHLICTVHFRNNYEDLLKISCRWANTQRYIIDNSNRKIYGTGSFLRRDYLGDCNLIPNFFSEQTLYVTGHYEEVAESFKKEKVKINVYEMPRSLASSKYEEAKEYLLNNANKYKNIIFSCGPIGKVLISDLVSVCDSNLIDFGSMINVILTKHYPNLRTKWTVSWANNIDIIKRANMFFNKIRKL